MEPQWDVVADLQRKFAAVPRPLAFKGSSQADWQAWQEALYARLMELMAPWPEPVEPVLRPLGDPIDKPGHIVQRVAYTVEAGLEATAWLLQPKQPRLLASGKSPAVAALHGHGAGGSHSVAGNPLGLPGLESEINGHNYDYAAQLADRGYFVLAPDARGWGDRGPLFAGAWPGRDGCNVAHIMGELTGWCLQTLNTSDDMRALDILAALPEVDGEALGALGLSFGGTRTLYLAATDRRVKCAVVACYLSLWSSYAIGMGNFCGSQYVPKLGAECELPDLFGLIAPRPLLCEVGEKDDGFPVQASLEAWAQVARIYQAAGVPEKAALDLFDGGHQFSGRLAFDFLVRWLG